MVKDRIPVMALLDRTASCILGRALDAEQGGANSLPLVDDDKEVDNSPLLLYPARRSRCIHAVVRAIKVLNVPIWTT
jgi:hypothetical protein